jgi:hypothetical protein
MAFTDSDTARCVQAWIDGVPHDTVQNWCGFPAIGRFIARYLPTPPRDFPAESAARKELARTALANFTSLHQGHCLIDGHRHTHAAYRENNRGHSSTAGGQ